MDTTTLVRIIAGVLAVAVLAFLIYRRKHAKVFSIDEPQRHNEGHHGWYSDYVSRYISDPPDRFGG